MVGSGTVVKAIPPAVQRGQSDPVAIVARSCDLRRRLLRGEAAGRRQCRRLHAQRQLPGRCQRLRHRRAGQPAAGLSGRWLGRGGRDRAPIRWSACSCRKPAARRARPRTSRSTLNLNSASTVPSDATASTRPTPYAFDRFDPATYNQSTQTTIYDASGNAQTMTNYFVRDDQPDASGNDQLVGLFLRRRPAADDRRRRPRRSR